MKKTKKENYSNKIDAISKDLKPLDLLYKILCGKEETGWTITSCFEEKDKQTLKLLEEKNLITTKQETKGRLKNPFLEILVKEQYEKNLKK